MKRAVLAVAFLAVACSTTSAPQPQPTVSESSPAPTVLRTSSPQSTGELLVAVDCRSPLTPTVASTEGPYFKAGSPEKASLVTEGMSGDRILLAGMVVTRSCKPIANAKVDIWQANATGEYDNAAYTLRGHVLTDGQGKYQIETLVPGRYPGRTPHIHVKVEPPGGRVLTTQLYMPNEAGNASDGIFRPELTMKVERLGDRMVGTFVFVLDLP